MLDTWQRVALTEHNANKLLCERFSLYQGLITERAGLCRYRRHTGTFLSYFLVNVVQEDG
jgi:hypothetical protein